MNARLPLIIVSGPSGSGKSTVIARVLAEGDLPLRLSVSATTRAPRPGEADGVAYYFWTRERFEEELRKGAFLEWASVHGSYYGTLQSEVEPYRQQGKLVILDIDVQGAAQVRQRCTEVVTVFLKSPSLEVDERRLRDRGTEDEASIQRRLAAARRELASAGEYDYQIVNDDLEQTVEQFRAILKRYLKRESNAG
jgi:guanylate kinase